MIKNTCIRFKMVVFFRLILLEKNEAATIRNEIKAIIAKQLSYKIWNLVLCFIILTSSELIELF